MVKHLTLSDHPNKGEVDLRSHHLADREQGLPRNLVVPPPHLATLALRRESGREGEREREREGQRESESCEV